MTRKILRSLTCFLFVLSTATLVRADRDADRRKERIPVGHQMHPPWHPSTKPSDSSSPTGNGYTPQQLRHAYGFDQLGATGTGQIIALIEAYGSPTIQSDLDTFCAAFGLPSTTVQVYYPQGQPAANSSWESEISLDVEWAHAIAPGATIALIVAQSNSTANLYGAVDYAANLPGVTQVSMSWGSSEYSTEETSDFHFNVPGVTFFASSGDSGAGVGFPACSPYVVGVGGTSLNLDSSGNITSETAWSGSGGGMSAYETLPSYQAGWWSGARRGVPDVAYDADPNTGVPVYLTGSGWRKIGGTSMGAPQWAALCALANSLRSQSINPAPVAFYSLANANYAGYYHDIISGNNGAYSAGPDYDLVTGLGSPIANQLVLALGGLPFQVAAPVFSPAPGAYLYAQNVTIATTAPGATIRYTTDGSTPSETNGTVYFGAVNIGSTTTLQAIAYESGFTDSGITSGAYIIGQVAAPTFSPSPGIFVSSVTVTISTTANGASIRYTTDGSTPSETNGALYSGPVKISTTTTLQAMAYEAGFVDSAVTSGSYSIYPPTQPPVFSPPAGTYSGPQMVSITSATTGASIRYTTDGSTPKYNSGIIYSGPVTINVTTTLKAVAYYNYTSVIVVSPVTTGIYTIAVPAAAPVFSPAAGTYSSAQTVTITSATSGASIRYTTDGSTPTETNGTLYSESVVVSSSTMLKAIAYAGGFGDSPATSGLYTISSSPADVFNVVYDFPASGSAGIIPGGLVVGSDGNFYGTTTAGGGAGYGTVFEMTPAGVLTALASFNSTDGDNPGTLVQGTDGNFYGTTSSGGSADYGTAFQATPAGVLTTLISFNSATGTIPGALVQGSDGNFYGTTASGGSGNNGTVFKMTSAGALTTLFSFNYNNGTSANALLQGSDGNFYGTTSGGGASFVGTAFKMTPAGDLTTLVSFSSLNGANPEAALVQGSDGNFYGTTFYGGSGDVGTVFKITSAGILTTLVSFDGANGAHPRAALVQGNDGNFYGTTYSGGSADEGTVFKITPKGDLTTLVSFSGANGLFPYASLVQGNDGNLYGTCAQGGASNEGVFFQLIVPSPLPIPGWALHDFNGDGKPDILWRNTTTGDTAVLLMNGTSPASFASIGNFPLPWGVVAVGDFNHDGNADILWRNATTGEIGVMLMNGTTATSYVSLGVVDLSWTVAGLGDFNNDGQTDILWQNTSTGTVGFWSLNGTTVTGFTAIGTIPSPWTIVGTGDFNGDGQADLLWYNPTTGDLLVSLMNGATVTGYQGIGTLPVPWTVAGTADFNGDRSVDILVRNATTGDVGIWLMNGTTPTSFVPLGNVPAPWQPSD
jgi:uncharacterized repeat protein (TIGR03803 family)